MTGRMILGDTSPSDVGGRYFGAQTWDPALSHLLLRRPYNVTSSTVSYADIGAVLLNSSGTAIPAMGSQSTPDGYGVPMVARAPASSTAIGLGTTDGTVTTPQSLNIVALDGLSDVTIFLTPNGVWAGGTTISVWATLDGKKLWPSSGIGAISPLATVGQITISHRALANSAIVLFAKPQLAGPLFAGSYTLSVFTQCSAAGSAGSAIAVSLFGRY